MADEQKNTRRDKKQVRELAQKLGLPEIAVHRARKISFYPDLAERVAAGKMTAQAALREVRNRDGENVRRCLLALNPGVVGVEHGQVDGGASDGDESDS